MSALQSVLERLDGRLDAGVLAAVRAACGKKVSRAERSAVGRWLHGLHYAEVGVARALTEGLRAPSRDSLAPIFSTRLRVPEASALVVTPDHWLIVADDDRGVYTARGDTCTLALAAADWPSVRGLEGLCCGVDGELLGLTEAGVLLVLDPDGPRVERRGVLEPLATRENKGWEGVDVFYRGVDPLLVAVNEADPWCIALYDPDTLVLRRIEHLPRDLGLADLSDVAVDPLTQRIFVLSDESRALACLRLGPHAGMSIEGRWSLDVPRKLKVEGIAFDAAAQLWMVADGADEAFVFWVPSD